MPIMVNATARKASSNALVPPIRATMSRAALLSPNSSPMPCTTLPISKPYRQRPTVHSTSAARSSRHARPKALPSAGPAVPGPGRSAMSPAPTSRPASSRYAATVSAVAVTKCSSRTHHRSPA